MHKLLFSVDWISEKMVLYYYFFSWTIFFLPFCSFFYRVFQGYRSEKFSCCHGNNVNKSTLKFTWGVWSCPISGYLSLAGCVLHTLCYRQWSIAIQLASFHCSRHPRARKIPQVPQRILAPAGTSTQRCSHGLLCWEEKNSGECNMTLLQTESRRVWQILWSPNLARKCLPLLLTTTTEQWLT